ncbi:hypothetical protein [Pedobacter psychroterrae]|uniref:Lipocalin-like protein n=1 Tax=Pedobacter psychroterrae TaxID=2530453 RepID=A0A4R0NM44_9SPHI|nr:hypothetical protein [Pedobacter psychroterrae]TCD00384.1 hypothetical protein EZ437_14255 [Pedobacter psychroterrae]
MKNKILILTLAATLICAAAIAQTQKKKVNNATIKTSSHSTAHIGTWKLISQKITYQNGQMLLSDSGSVFLRKILTPTNFVVIVEKKVPELNNRKIAASVSGGIYSLENGNYQEFTKYAAFDGFEKMKINYKLTIKDGKLHTVGTIGGPEIYEEIYERVDW